MIGTTDTGSTSYCVITPNAPGDLVACRSLLAQIGLMGKTKFVAPQLLTPLIEDLTQSHPALGSFNWLFDDITASWTKHQKARLFTECQDSVLIDLLGAPALTEFIREYKVCAWGHDFGDCTNVYDRCAPWRISPNDRTHYSVRMLRILPGFAELMEWPNSMFERGFFTSDRRAPDPRCIALMPGCGIGGIEKRMPQEFWLEIAKHIRENDLKPVWFLGPDEQDMKAHLVENEDRVVMGEWDQSLTAHAECALGIANDTSHVHIRTHLRRNTIVLYRRDEYQEWGSYPNYITPVMPGTSCDERLAISTVKTYIDQFIAGSV